MKKKSWLKLVALLAVSGTWRGQTIRKSYIFFLVIAVLLFTNRSHAVPVFGEIFDLRQPDGSTIKVRVWGDEFYRVVESLDGYTLIRDPESQEICYAELSVDGNDLVSTGVTASRPLPAPMHLKPHVRINRSALRDRVRAARDKLAKSDIRLFSELEAFPIEPPCNGNIKGICLIVDFDDEPNTISPSDINDLCNKIGYNGYGNNGSVHDYFYDVSDDKLAYNNYVPQIYYRAKNNKEYYEDDTESEFGVRARELVIEALNWLDEKGFNFSDYDSDNDGWIDAINCFYVGTFSPLEGEDGLWPHSWAFDPTEPNSSFSADGVSFFRYQISDIKDSPGIGTFCHENGHLICWWPDLYDTDRIGSYYESSGTGKYCLMSSGHDTNPVQPCAYLKDLAGWATVTTLGTPQSNISVTVGVNSFFKFPHPRLSNEFFLISNRQRIGRDLNLPDSGLAIWHIDEDGNNNNQQMTPESHYMVTLVQADGRWDLENGRNRGDWNDLFNAGSVNSCTPFTDPSTSWWAGNSSAMSITNISSSGETMWFDFSIDPSPPTAVDQAVVATFGESMTITLQGLDDYLPDPPGQLTYIITSLPRHGTLEDPGTGLITETNKALVDFGNTVVYTNQEDYLGADSFSFKANDGGSHPTGGDSNQATVSIQVSMAIYVDDDAEHDPGPGNPDVSDPLEDGSAEHPFDAIQEAIDAALSTEVINILSGTYTGNGNRNIDFKGKAIKLRSENGPGSCIIDCQNSARGFYFHRGEGPDSVLEGLNITNGYADNQGGGIYCKNGSRPTVTHCMFSNNSAQWGASMFNESSSPTLNDCDFVGNQASSSGGGMYNYKSDPTLNDCTFSENLAQWGGGMYNYDSSPVLINCDFIRNEAKVTSNEYESSGGGMLNGSSSNPILTECTFRENSADWGGGVYNDDSSPTIRNCEFSNNAVIECGGGIENENGSCPTVTSCTFIGNLAEFGAGLRNYSDSHAIVTDCEFINNDANGYGGGMQNDYSNPTVTECAFSDNSANRSGGGLANYESNPVLTGCTFSENFAKWGGGVRNYASNPTLTNCTFIGNLANNSGGGVQSQISNVTIINCTFSANSSYWGGGVYNNSADSVTTLTNCILWNNIGSNGAQIYSNGGGSVVVTYSDIQGGWEGDTNIDVDPLFADPENGDYHLKSQAGRWDPFSESWIMDDVTSPCIDAGDPASPLGDEPSPNGGIINMGAYGGTSEASKSPSNQQSSVDFENVEHRLLEDN